MLQQMIVVIRVMKDPKKLGTLNGAIAARLTALYGPAEAARIYRATADHIELEHPEAIPSDDPLYPAATAPASCTERMAHTGRSTDTAGVTTWHGPLGHPCPECNAQPGEPCADPLGPHRMGRARYCHRCNSQGCDLCRAATPDLING